MVTRYIYQGRGESIYDASNFDGLMKKLGAKSIGPADSEKTQITVYSLEPQGLTVGYSRNEDGNVNVLLIGKEKQIKGIERIILKEMLIEYRSKLIKGPTCQSQLPRIWVGPNPIPDIVVGARHY